MKTVKDALEHVHEELGHFEAALRQGLPSPHMADTVAGVRTRLAGAMEHPDAAADVEAMVKAADDKKAIADKEAAIQAEPRMPELTLGGDKPPAPEWAPPAPGA